ERRKLQDWPRVTPLQQQQVEENPMDSYIEPIDAPWQQGSDVPPGAERDYSPNVQGLERAVSGVGGVALLAMALRRGGLFGLLQAAVGTGLLVRGVTGHCSAKRMLAPSRFETDI